MTDDDPRPDPQGPEPTRDSPEPATGPAPPAAAAEPDATDLPPEPDQEPDAEPDQEPAADPDPPAGEAPAPAPDEPPDPEPEPEPAGTWRRQFGVTRLVVALLLGLLGFTFAIQVRSVAEDPTVAALGEEDLVRILANLDAHEQRLRQDIDQLQDTRRRLSTAGQSQQEALAEAERRADELGILAGTLPAEGPGVRVQLQGGPEVVDAGRMLDAVQELRGAGAEAMQIEGAEGRTVRVVASTHFLDSPEGLLVDGQPIRNPYLLVAIGEPQTLSPALNIPGGVAESVQQDGGTVTVHEEPGGVQVSAVRQPQVLQHARPDS